VKNDGTEAAMTENKLILVTGGARSGKSRFAEELANQFGQPVTYIATAQIYDTEMQERVSLHRARRPEQWITVEAPFDAAERLREAGRVTPVVLLDCLTLFVTNHLLRATPPDDAAGDKQRKQRERVWTAVEELVSAAKSVPACVLVVTNEVGWGIVPDNVLSRLFRDVAGLANQRLAAAADDVYMLVSGLPLRLKSLKH